MREAIKRQKELNDLCRRNTAQAQMRQRRKNYKKLLPAKPYMVGQHSWLFQNVVPPKENEEASEEMVETITDYRGTPARSVLSLEHGASRALRKPETSCIITGGLV